MSAITTHVLDTARGAPAVGVPVRLELGPALIEPGTYRLVFDTSAYARAGEFQAEGAARPGSLVAAPTPAAFFPEVTVTFTVAEHSGHYHVPLLLSPFGYSTYRGS